MLTSTMYRVKGTTRSHSYLTICTNPGGKFVISLLMFHFTQTMPEAMLSTLNSPCQGLASPQLLVRFLYQGFLAFL